MKCVVKILDKYLQILPVEARYSDVFNIKSLKSYPPNPDTPWFASIPIKNKLNGLILQSHPTLVLNPIFVTNNLFAFMFY